MPKYEFPMNRIFPYKDRINNSVLIWKITDRRKPELTHILHTEWPRVAPAGCFERARLLKVNDQHSNSKTQVFITAFSITSQWTYNVFKASATSHRRLIVVETTSCAYYV